MVYRVRVFDRYTGKELSAHFVEAELLTAFLEKFLTKTTRIEILEDYYC